MEGDKRIVIVGIPAVGKTTLIEHVVGALRDMHADARVVSFGTEMLKQAEKEGLGRDELRRQSLESQQGLQEAAARSIAAIGERIVIIDTHAFISTPSGYYPGLPSDVLDIIKPTIFISLTANPEMISRRRLADKSRSRDKVSIPIIKRELDIQDAMISACSVHSGSPIKPVYHGEGESGKAAMEIIKAIGL